MELVLVFCFGFFDVNHISIEKMLISCSEHIH